jgi:hypothetical protein
MTDSPPAPRQDISPPLPPETFDDTMEVPETGYRTAIAIKHDGRMKQVSVRFVLGERNGQTATYHATCPRCHAGDIEVTVKLTPDGSFAEVPACPTLCVACEDRLDAILEPESPTGSKDEPADRATLGKYLKAMTTRAWD